MHILTHGRRPLALLVSAGFFAGLLLCPAARADGDKKDGGKKGPGIQVGKPIIKKDPPKPPKKDG